LEIARVEKAENQRYASKSVQDLADMLHKDPVDAMLDLALGEDLATGFSLLAANYDPAAGRQADHNAQCDAGVPCYLLHEWVHRRQATTLEEAVRRLTSEPADWMGLSNKGRIHS
jgi:N-acyl-D-amino-acid deacylase